jgi:hypothetical protein
MKPLLFACMLLTLAIGKSHATQQNASQPVVHELVYESCHFTMKDPYGGRLTLSTGGGTTANYHAIINPKAKQPFETWIVFDCEKASDTNNFSGSTGVKKKDGKWAIAFDADAEALNTKLYPLHGNKWDGAGITQDQSAGDDNGRPRSFTFCLVHAKQALCGSSSIVAYLEYPDESVLPQIIKLLESIEFIDTPTSTSTSPLDPSSQ